MKWLTIGATPALVLALTSTVACRKSHAPAPPLGSASAIANSANSADPGHTVAPAKPEELAVVAPLAPGTELGGFAVRDITGVQRGRMRVVLAKKDAVVRLDIALADPEGPVPPATTERYEIYYSLRGGTPEDGERLAKKLAAVITKNAAPPPAGMTKFIPDPKGGTEL